MGSSPVRGCGFEPGAGPRGMALFTHAEYDCGDDPGREGCLVCASSEALNKSKPWSDVYLNSGRAWMFGLLVSIGVGAKNL